MEEATFDPLSGMLGGDAEPAPAPAPARSAMPAVRAGFSAETLTMPDIGSLGLGAQPPAAPAASSAPAPAATPAPAPAAPANAVTAAGDRTTFSAGFEAFSGGIPAASSGADVLGELTAPSGGGDDGGGLFGSGSVSAPAPAPAAAADLFGSSTGPKPSSRAAGALLAATDADHDDAAEARVDDLMVGRILEREEGSGAGKSWLAEKVTAAKSDLDPLLSDDKLLGDGGSALLGTLEAATATAPAPAPAATPVVAAAAPAAAAATASSAALDDDLFSYVGGGANSGAAADPGAGDFNLDDYIAQNAAGSGSGGGLFD